MVASRVLGMGWLSSVGIAQHLIRQLMLRAPSLGAGLPPGREIRKDRPMPSTTKDYVNLFWDAYVEDIETMALYGRLSNNEPIVPNRETSSVPAELTAWQQSVREALDSWGAPRHAEKAQEGVNKYERIGALFDGEAGFATGTTKKLLELLGIALAVLQCPAPSGLYLRVLLGRLLHRMQFRSPTMGCLARTWKYLKRWGSSRVCRWKSKKTYSFPSVCSR